MKRIFSTTSVFSLLIFFVQAQNPETQNIEDGIVQHLESSTTTEIVSDDAPEIEQLEYLRNHPLDLNTASQDELLQFPFLNEQMIARLLGYKKEFGPLMCLEELQVAGFEPDLIRELKPYVQIRHDETVSMNPITILEQSNKSILVRTRKKTTDPETETTYPGSPYYLRARIQLEYKNRVAFQLQGEKDPGEDFFSGNQKSGFDFYSAYFSWKGSGHLQKIIVGDYHLQYGQGLIAWNGIALGSGQDVVSISRQGRGIITYRGSDENNFFRGGAVSLASGKFTTDFFYSKHSIDAGTDTIRNEISENIIVSSLPETGYHRSNSELQTKHSIDERTFGTHLNYKQKQMSAGLTLVHTDEEQPLEKSPALYNVFDRAGKRSGNIGCDFKSTFGNTLLFGELAMDDNQYAAMLLGAMASLSPILSAGLLYRRYSTEYYSQFGSAFAENSSVSNENGTYAGLQWKISRTLLLNASTDFFQFPWLKYRVSAPSAGSRMFSDLAWSPGKTFQADFRVTHTEKEENSVEELSLIDKLHQIVKEDYRCTFHYKPGIFFDYYQRVELLVLKPQEEKVQHGFVISQQLNMRVLKSIQLSAQYSLYQTTSFDSRIYLHEISLPGAFSISPLYGKASKFILASRIRCLKKMEISFSYSATLPSTAAFQVLSQDTKVVIHTREFATQVKLNF